MSIVPITPCTFYLWLSSPQGTTEQHYTFEQYLYKSKRCHPPPQPSDESHNSLIVFVVSKPHHVSKPQRILTDRSKFCAESSRGWSESLFEDGEDVPRCCCKGSLMVREARSEVHQKFKPSSKTLNEVQQCSNPCQTTVYNPQQGLKQLMPSSAIKISCKQDSNSDHNINASVTY